MRYAIDTSVYKKLWDWICNWNISHNPWTSISVLQTLEPRITAKYWLTDGRFLNIYRKSYMTCDESVGTKMNDLDLCLEVV